MGFLKLGTTPTNVVLRDNVFTTFMYLLKIFAYSVPQCLMVIYWLSGLWPYRLEYPNVHPQISKSVKSKETRADGVPN